MRRNTAHSRRSCPSQELKRKQFEQQRKQVVKDVRLSAYTAEADLKVGCTVLPVLVACTDLFSLNKFQPLS